MASNSQRNAEEAAQQQQEIDVLKARWAADDEAARQAEDSARARQQQLNLEVKEFNRCSTRQKQESAPCAGPVMTCCIAYLRLYAADTLVCMRQQSRAQK